MKKSELQKIISEEIKNLLNEEKETKIWVKPGETAKVKKAIENLKKLKKDDPKYDEKLKKELLIIDKILDTAEEY